MFSVLDHWGNNKNGLHSVATLGGGGVGLRRSLSKKEEKTNLDANSDLIFYPSV